MTVREICGFIESRYPLDYQEDFDNSGLIIGSYSNTVSKVLITLDVTMETIREAITSGCSMIIAHHPLIFRGLKKITGSDLTQRIVLDSIKNDIAIYAAHTNLDNSLEGLNKFLASKLSLNNCRILTPQTSKLIKLVTFCPHDHVIKVRNALFEAGAGNLGNYDSCSFNLEGEGTFRAGERAKPYIGEKNEFHFEKETRIEVILPAYLKEKILSALHTFHPYEEVAYDLYLLENTFAEAGSGLTGELETPVSEHEFLTRVKELTGIPVIRHSPFTGKMIRKVTICTGSGAFLIKEARASGSELFLTSDIKYHDFFEYADEMVLADIGHYESEQFVKELLYEILIKKFPNFAFLVSKTVTNPVNYF